MADLDHRPRPSAPSGARSSAPSKARPKARSGARPAPGSGSPTPASRRTRRRFARRQWVRRWLTWRYLLALVLVVAVIVGGVYLVLFSATLRVRGAEVTGVAAAGQRQIVAAADVPTGGPLATVDLGAIRDRVGALASVRSVDVTRSWPHQVRISVTLRTPVAVMSIGGLYRGLDQDGVLFGHYRTPPSGLPVIETGDSGSGAQAAARNADGLREAARVAAALPSSIRRLTDHVQLISADDVELDLHDHRVVRWGSSVDSATKARVLAVLLQRDARVYDVSVPSSPVTTD